MKNKPIFFFVFITIILLLNIGGILFSLLFIIPLKASFFNIVTNGKTAFLIMSLCSLPQVISFFFLYKLKKIGFLLFYITLFITLFLELSDIFFMTPTILSEVNNSVITSLKMWEFRFGEGTFYYFNILTFFIMDHYRKKYVGSLFKKDYPDDTPKS